MLTQNELIEKVLIKERLLRFWIKEYNLKKFVNSRKTGNLYNEEIVYFINCIKYLKDSDVFSTNGIKNIVKSLKKQNKSLIELDFLKEYSLSFDKNIAYYDDLKENLNENNKDTSIEDTSIEDKYIKNIMEAELLIGSNKKKEAKILLKEVSLKSSLYNRIAFEMLSMIDED
ncbi:MAG: MerR family transcriptional regulator [Candidatus Muirbacterium halophilum]|nr:MerR family transcriptional regulator [Candidatus Muirbacterium halophilum]